MQIGIVGLPYSGKSTLFSTLIKHHGGEGASHKSGAERGIVKVPDTRLDRLTEIFRPKKQVNTTIEYIKVPGLESDHSESKGLPARFLSNLKTVDTLLLMVRNFKNEYYPHPLDRIDPAADIQFINSEFLISDLMIVENRIERLEKTIMKTQDEKEKRELALMQRLQEQLEQEIPLRELTFSEDEAMIIKGYQFITAKPVLYVLNIAEDQISDAPQLEAAVAGQVGKNSVVTSLSAEIEKEISELDEDDTRVFLEEAGISEPALDKLIRASYELLGLISFFTVGDDECRSWTIKAGTNARKAAGAIHSDFEKGFIRAEVVHFDDFVRLGSLRKCRDEGILRLEGKQYIVKDGDILTIRFNV